MYCRICGSEENVRYYATKRQALCPYCSKDTPPKVNREAFDKKYWAGDNTPPPDSIKREFYADYLASCHGSIESYIEATTSYVM